LTGAAQGLGLAIARALAVEGRPVAIADLDAAGAELAAREIGAGCLGLACDVTEEAQVVAAFAAVERQVGPIDLLVHCPATFDPAVSVAEMPLAVWERTLAVDLTGAFLCCREAARCKLPRKRGKIITLSSVAGKMAYPLRAGYAAAKAGLISLTRTLAAEAAASGIQVNAICPGPVEGPRMERIIRDRARALDRGVEEVAEEFRRTTALNQFVRPEDVVALVLYLASPAGDRITGQAIDVDAGYLL